MDHTSNGNIPADSPGVVTGGIIYASQSHLNNASSASTVRTSGAAAGSGHLLNSATLSPSISSPSPPNKIGIYGWRKRCLYLLILVILVVAILNLALTVWIIRVVRLSSEGLGPVEIGDDSVHVCGDVDFLGAIHASEIKSVGDASLIVESLRELKFQAAKRGDEYLKHSNPSMTLNDNQVNIRTDDFLVQNCAGDTLLRARTNAELEIGAGAAEDVGVKILGEGGASFEDGVVTSKIEAPSADNLEISSRTNRIDIFGARGLNVAAKSGGLSLKAMDDITIVSNRGKLVLDADIRMMDLPLVNNRDKDSKIEAFQLCVCDNGRLFLSGAKDSCSYSNVCS